jgi:hypothetical protein
MFFCAGCVYLLNLCGGRAAGFHGAEREGPSTSTLQSLPSSTNSVSVLRPAKIPQVWKLEVRERPSASGHQG